MCHGVRDSALVNKLVTISGTGTAQRGSVPKCLSDPLRSVRGAQGKPIITFTQEQNNYSLDRPRARRKVLAATSGLSPVFWEPGRTVHRAAEERQSVIGEIKQLVSVFWSSHTRTCNMYL